MAKKIKVVVNRPDEEYGHMTNISDSLENLQKTVEGYIEVYPLADDVVIICNEEGRLRNLEPNFSIRGGPQFYGTVIFAGIDGEEFADLPMNFREFKERFFCN